MRKILRNCMEFLKKETVLSLAILLALISTILVPPSPAYIGYIDWDTLALLFGLMAVVKGLQKAGVFVFLGNLLLKKTVTSRRMLFVLVFLPFALSMIVTNDVSLITFVPFGMIVLQIAGQERLVAPLVVLQTIAANLGSMLTPMGNPQNLYLYTRFNISASELCQLMLPYVVISGICLAVMILFCKSAPVSTVSISVKLGSRKAILFCCLGFALCLLGIFKIIPPLAIVPIVVIFLLISDRELLASVDYSLLGTFVALFILIGNIGCMERFRDFLISALSGRVELVAVLASQVISNVPAALLLSGFTDQWQDLIVGCNLGGLGTLIASMASLISYKMLAKEYPDKRKKYIMLFTLCNLGLLALLILASLLMGRR